MFIISETHCQQCKILKQMLGDKAMTTEFRLASQNMDTCRELGIKAIPALVKDDKTVIFNLDDIVTEIEKDVK